MNIITSQPNRKHLIFAIIVTILIIIVFASCKTSHPITVPIHDSTSLIVTEDITDTYTWTNPDSILFRFAIECDSNYNALLKQYYELNSRIESEVIIEPIVRWKTDGTKVNQLLFSISGYIDSIAMRDRTIYQLRNEKKYVEVPYPVLTEVKFAPRWIKWIVAIFFVENLLILFLIVRKFKNKLLFWKK